MPHDVVTTPVKPVDICNRCVGVRIYGDDFRQAYCRVLGCTCSNRCSKDNSLRFYPVLGITDGSMELVFRICASADGKDWGQR